MILEERIIVNKSLDLKETIKFTKLMKSLLPNIALASSTKMINAVDLNGVLSLKLEAGKIIRVIIEHDNKKQVNKTLNIIKKYLE